MTGPANRAWTLVMLVSRRLRRGSGGLAAPQPDDPPAGGGDGRQPGRQAEGAAGMQRGARLLRGRGAGVGRVGPRLGGPGALAGRRRGLLVGDRSGPEPGDL